jgi:uncharacterized protein DUF5916
MFAVLLSALLASGPISGPTLNPAGAELASWSTLANSLQQGGHSHLSQAGDAPSSGDGDRTKAGFEVPTLAAEIDLDGELNEVVWQQAQLIDGFTEVDPFEGRPADPRTEVLMWRSSTHLYLGVRFFEPDPGSMVRQNMLRDAFLRDDDRFVFVLDTFSSGKQAYFFQISAAGSRGDALIGDTGQRFNKRWDGFWEGQSKIQSDRWTAEIKIPFQSMASSENGVWLANFERFRGSTRTRYRWSGAKREYGLFNTQHAGQISGLDQVDQGLGLSFVPYAKTKFRNINNGPNSLDSGMGGELDWWMTPQLKMSLTVNTDFAETEVDGVQINLSQYSLFFPEKRDFFLEDANLFEFGPRGNDLVPFHSRRIGLVNGQEIGVNSGARLSGRAGPWDLGMLAVGTEATALSSGAQVPNSELFVLRPSYNFNDEVAVGALMTYGNPESNSTNLVTGADVRYNADLFTGQFNLNTYALRSDDEATGKIGGIAGVRASLRTSNWRFSQDLFLAKGDFDPGLGFVRRPGQSNFNTDITWEPRPVDSSSSVRLYQFRLRPTLWFEGGGQIMSHNLDATLFGVEWHSGNKFSITSRYSGDRVVGAGFAPGGVSVAPDYYAWSDFGLEFQSSEAQALSYRLRTSAGSWYDGSISRFSARVNWRPGSELALGLNYSENQARLDNGDFVTRILAVRGDFFYSPDLSWQNLIQADNQSQELGWQSRLRWIHRDGQELFLVANAGWQQDLDGTILPSERDFTIKLVYSVRL